MATTTAKDAKWALPDGVPSWVLWMAVLLGPAPAGAIGAWAGGVSVAQIDALDARVNTLEHNAAAVQPITERRLSEVEAAVEDVGDQLGRISDNQWEICVKLEVPCKRR